MTKYFFQVQHLFDEKKDFLSSLSKHQFAKIHKCLNHSYNENKKEVGDSLLPVLRGNVFGFVTDDDYIDCLGCIITNVE